MKAGFFLFWLWMVTHMADSSISSIRYNDISDDKVDIAVTKLKCPVALIRNRCASATDFEFEKHCQL
jgi:hypothetical protein